MQKGIRTTTTFACGWVGVCPVVLLRGIRQTSVHLPMFLVNPSLRGRQVGVMGWVVVGTAVFGAPRFLHLFVEK